MELLLVLSALKRNGADKVHVFLTYLSYCRSDRPVGDFKATSGADVLQLIAFSGACSISVVDAHSEILLATVPNNVFCRNISSNSLTEEVIKQIGHENLVIVSPDIGALKRCKYLIAYFKTHSGVELELVVLDKTRKKPNEVEGIQLLVGQVDKKRCLILDDMVDTGVG